jgi:hypothetical protein
MDSPSKKNYWWLLAAGLGALGISLVFILKKKNESDSITPQIQNIDSDSATLTDQEPFQSPCLFWEPWKRLVAPEPPVAYLKTISEMLVDGASRTSEYIDLIMRDPGMMGALRGDSEEICIAGKFTGNEGKYQLLADRSKVCQLPTAKFLEQNLAINITPLKEGGFDNHFRYKLHLGHTVPAQFRSFWLTQMELIKNNYRGWSVAFPEYFGVNKNGFGLVKIQNSTPEQPLVGVGGVKNAMSELRLDWLTQAMMSSQIDWATFLLKLGDLAKVEMWAETDFSKDFNGEKPFQGRLLATIVETRLSAINVQIPHDSRNFFQGIIEVPLIIGHDVLVNFRGIQVLVRGLKYRGTLHSDDSQFAFDGFFEGVDKVEISGAYRGIGMASGLGKMIQGLIQEVIDREISRLKKGHLGRPAQLRIGLYKNGSNGQFEVESRFDAAVNVLNIIREEKDQVESPVMPNKKTIKDLNDWAKKTIQALIRDYELVDKKVSCPAL